MAETPGAMPEGTGSLSQVVAYGRQTDRTPGKAHAPHRPRLNSQPAGGGSEMATPGIPAQAQRAVVVRASGVAAAAASCQ